MKFNQRLKDKECLLCYTVIVPHKSMQRVLAYRVQEEECDDLSSGI